MQPSMYPGVKWPDENALPSVAYQSRDILQVTTNASGIYVMQCNAALNQIAYTCNDATITTTSSSLSGKFTTVNTSQYTNLTATYFARRCVGLECRFICTQAPLYTQGAVLFSSIPQSSSNSVLVPVSIASQIANDVEHVIMPLAKFSDCTAQAHLRPIDYNVRDFKGVTLTDCEGWSSLVLAVYGAAASTNIGQIEIVANWELQLATGSPAIGVTPANLFSVEALSKAINVAHVTPFLKIGATALGSLTSMTLGSALRSAPRVRMRGQLG